MALVVLIIPVRSWAQNAIDPYSVSIFATAPAGLSEPDSVTFSSRRIYIGYGNGAATDGSSGVSDVVEYDFQGNMLRDFQVAGHNDGLRFNPNTQQLLAIQNEDANSTLILINLKTGKQTVLPLDSPHGGGFDDVAVNGRLIYLSASNPTSNPNTGPAIVSLSIDGTSAIMKSVLSGDTSATDVTSGDTITLNIQDPDSMVLDRQGELVMSSQADGELVIVQHVGRKCQNVEVVPITSADGGDVLGQTELDDTVFATTEKGRLIVADKGLNTIYAITTASFPRAAYSSVGIPNFYNPSESFIAQTDLTSGFVTPIVTGMSVPGGMAFIPSGISLARYIARSANISERCPAS